MSDWKQQFTFLASEDAGIESEVQGQTMRFKPASLSLLLKLKDMSGPISKLLAVLFTNKGQDTGHVDRCETEAGITESIQEAISPKLAEIRHQKMEEALAEVTTLVTGPEVQELLGSLILDSVKDNLFKEGAKPPPPKEFMSQIPAIAIPDFLKGVWLANRGFFGPLETMLGPLSAQVIASIQTRINATDVPSDPDPL